MGIAYILSHHLSSDKQTMNGITKIDIIFKNYLWIYCIYKVYAEVMTTK